MRTATSTTTRTLTTTALGAALACGLTLSAAPAMANDADVIRRGDCTGATNWKLKASPEDGRIEVEGEIDSNRNNQTWRWRMVHNGSLAARGRAVTRPPSGSFERRRVLVDLKGVDRIVFRAWNPANGEVCHAVVRF